jgi:hypothetical protein
VTGFFRAAVRSPAVFAGTSLILVMTAVALVSAWQHPEAGLDVRVEDRLQPPLSARSGMRHWLGTDSLGRDILLRLASGARVSLLIGASAVLIGGTVGTALGLVAATQGGASIAPSCEGDVVRRKTPPRNGCLKVRRGTQPAIGVCEQSTAVIICTVMAGRTARRARHRCDGERPLRPASPAPFARP